jgi:hypothetical protein
MMMMLGLELGAAAPWNCGQSQLANTKTVAKLILIIGLAATLLFAPVPGNSKTRKSASYLVHHFVRNG